MRKGRLLLGVGLEEIPSLGACVGGRGKVVNILAYALERWKKIKIRKEGKKKSVMRGPISRCRTNNVRTSTQLFTSAPLFACTDKTLTGQAEAQANWPPHNTPLM